jgi:predicted transcriptional regulator
VSFQQPAMKARDVMTSDVVSMHPDTAVRQIARLLLEKHISAVPVVKELTKANGQC